MKLKMKSALIHFFLLFILVISCSNSKKNEFKTNEEFVDFYKEAIDNDDLLKINDLFSYDLYNDLIIDENGNDFLGYAIQKEKYDIVIKLIENGSNVNHKDLNNISNFCKAINTMPLNCLEVFLNAGADYKEKTYYRDINYFEYMLVHEKYELALHFINNTDVLSFFSQNRNVFAYLIYYWDDYYSPLIGDVFLSNGYKIDAEIPLYFIAIDELQPNAIIWLKSLGINPDIKYYSDDFNSYFTALEYANNKQDLLSRFSGKDYFYESDSVEYTKIIRIIDFLTNSI